MNEHSLRQFFDLGEREVAVYYDESAVRYCGDCREDVRLADLNKVFVVRRRAPGLVCEVCQQEIR